MRILWLAIDHSQRVMDLFTPFRLAVARQEGVEVEFRVRTLGEIAGHVCRRLWGAQPRPEPYEPMIKDPRETDDFDFVMVDTAWLFHNEPWAGVKCPIGTSWGDNHGSMVPAYLDAAHALYDCFFPMLWESFEKMHLERFRDKHVQWFPWSFDPEMFKDYGQEQNISVLSTGVLSPNIYRVRTRAESACRDIPGFRRVKRPAETTGRDGWPVGVEYARLLNRARMSISCSGKWKYALAKTFEIPASRSVLVSDCCEDARALGFLPNSNMIEITTDMDAEEMRHYLRGYLSDPDVLGRIAQRGYDLMHQRHTNDVRAGEFVRHLRENVI